MKNNNAFILLYSAITLFAIASCSKDDNHNTPHPDRGAVILTLDMAATDKGEEMTTSPTLHLRGAENVTTDIDASKPATLPLLTPGLYGAILYNTPQGFTFVTDAAQKGKADAPDTFGSFTASVDKDTADGTIIPAPGALFAGNTDFTAIADDTLRVTIPMTQLTRRLRISLNVTGGDPESLASLSGTLSGVAGSVRMASGELSEPASVIPAFTREGDDITAPLNLLGLIGEQKLALSLTFTDGNIQTIEADLTEQLSGFNEGHSALEVSASIQTPATGQVGGATITDWSVQEEKDINVN